MREHLKMRMATFEDYETYRRLFYEWRGETGDIDWFDQPGALRRSMPSWKFLKFLVETYEILFLIYMGDEAIGYGTVESTDAGLLVQDVYIRAMYLDELRPKLAMSLRLALWDLLHSPVMCILFSSCNADIRVASNFHYQNLGLMQTPEFAKLKSEHFRLLLKGDYEGTITKWYTEYKNGEPVENAAKFKDRYFVYEAIRALHLRRGDKNSFRNYSLARGILNKAAAELKASKEAEEK